MTQSLFIGVDGGATKCVVRVEDESGNLLGREISGPANINVSVVKTWHSILDALEKIIRPLNISLQNKTYRFHAGMGLAGCEVKEAYQEFLKYTHPFHQLIVSSDAHTACLGAHQHQDGSIIVIGTGAVGFQIESMRTTKVSGWGFPHDDQGGGAWLGMEAVKITLQTLDGRLPSSRLSQMIFAHFKENLQALTTWANQANSTAFAELAPVVIAQCEAGDPASIALMKQAARAINQISEALKAKQLQSKKLPCALIGGLAPFIKPFLSENLQSDLVPAQSTPDQGAVLLVRKNLTCEAMYG